MADADRVVPIERFGQQYVTNHVNCGGCQKIINFDKWTTAIGAENSSRSNGWERTRELGWVCPECLFAYFEYLNVQPPWWCSDS